MISKASEEVKASNGQYVKDPVECSVATMDMETQKEHCCTAKNVTTTGCDPIKFDEMKDDKSESNSTTTTKTFKDNCIQTLCNITLITTLADYQMQDVWKILLSW